MFGTGPISWSSKKRPIVTLSSKEAEFVAITTRVCQAIWIRRILEEKELPQFFVIIVQQLNSPKIQYYMEGASILMRSIIF